MARKTILNENHETPITYNLESLKNVLGCGRHTAEKIASEAGAKIKIGRRVFYDRRAIEQYIAKHRE